MRPVLHLTQNFRQEIELMRDLSGELILSSSEFSKLGSLKFSFYADALKYAQECNVPVILEWDILMTESVFIQKSQLFKTMNFKGISSIRVEDPGALEFILSETPYSVQLILENGNHNLVAIQGWEDFIGDRLERLILSLEIPLLRLKEYKKSIKTPIELLGLGRKLIFYTPRGLLSPLHKKEDW